MKRTFILYYAVLFCLPYCSWSQEYSYTHYDISEGLAGSTVYCVTQDKDGFIWMGTETGVSRFDGTHFKNFTTADGLPDIEILQMFGDSKGRVWMAPFGKSICYYYRGRICNQDNDSLLKQIHLSGNIQNFAEDAKGNILVQERTALHWITPEGVVRRYDSLDHQAIRESVGISRSASGHFRVQAGEKIGELSGKGFSLSFPIVFTQIHPNFIDMNPQWAVWRETQFRYFIRSFATNKLITRSIDPYNFRQISFSLVDDSLLFVNESTGTTAYNLRTGLMQQYLPGKEVSRTFRDVTGNLWFTTLGQGIFRLNSDEFRTIALPTRNTAITSVHAITRIGNELWIGNDHNYFFRLSLPGLAMKEHRPLPNDNKNRILFIDTTANGNILFASDFGLDLQSRHSALMDLAAGTKSVFKKSPGELLIGAYWGAAFVNESNFKMDTIWRERSTAVYWRKDTSYIGTLNGLYFVTRNKPAVFLGSKIPFFRKRISSVLGSGDGILWVASYDAGIIGYKDGNVIDTITKKRGLTSDICRTLFIHNNVLWVGTDKGLNKVELNKPGYPITRYTSNDGLGSDIVNVIYADGSIIYVGTPAGLSYFDEARTAVNEECRLYLLSVINRGIDRIGDTAHLAFSYKESGIRLEFAGISYRSVGNITYKYRLKGIDSVWKETKDSYLEYPTLPSGKYQLQLQAINNAGIQSRLLSLPFEVETPFWRAVWFYVLILIVFLSLTWLLVSLRIRDIRRRQKEKDKLAQRMGELEHKALQSQMNPHFIFNCLNSIQQYIFDQDIFSANKYITGFARLIRATLYNSTQTFISLADEIDYLSAYLSLEKLRFKDKMDYSIRADPHIDGHALSIPPMLIQPFVENSMRHGLRHKTEGKGYIHITMKQTAGEELTITIEDNGIGRKRAARFKTGEHIEYQSKGMSMTADRVRMINSTYGGEIRIEITDLEDGLQQPAGTRVVLRFPLFYNPHQGNI